MSYYTRIYKWSRAGRTHIFGFSRIGWFVLAAILASGIWLIFRDFISYAGWLPIVIFLSFLLIAGLFGFGFYVRIGRDVLSFYEISFFFPTRRVSVPINQVKVNWSLSGQDRDPNIAYIFKSDDWTEMDESDWIEIDYRGKEYQMGSRSNIHELYSHLKDAIDRHSVQGTYS